MSISPLINRVAIVGGTHGNELTGAYLIKHFQNHPKLLQRHSLETLTVFGNPGAFAAGTRYVEKDLNRAFLESDLSNPHLSTYEDKRAKEICQLLGSKKQPQVDFIIDIHSTTSNMQFTIILGDRDPLVLSLVAYLCRSNPLVRVFNWATTQEQSFLRSLSYRSIAIEIGAIPHGVINAWFFERTQQLILEILDFLDHHNQKTFNPQSIPTTVDIYQGKAIVDYPRQKNGELQGMVHSQLVGQDYQPLQPGAPMFVTFTGQEIPYTGEEAVYPVFINESSYLEKGIAMVLCEKKTVAINF
ncbi:MAG: aspartoacylase [Cyanobacteria bacterium P01_C01_bin.72]